jgi:hypothetical protein
MRERSRDVQVQLHMSINSTVTPASSIIPRKIYANLRVTTELERMRELRDWDANIKKIKEWHDNVYNKCAKLNQNQVS